MDGIECRGGRRLLCSVFAILIALHGAPDASAATTAGSPGSTITIGGGRIDVSCDDSGLQLSCQKMFAWVQSSARAVTTYYGRFPVASLRLRIAPVVGVRIHGTTFGGKGSALIRIFMGNLTTDADLREDWVMTHEMVHLAFPSMPEQHNWIEEGIATYVEPIARAESGSLDVQTVWRELVEGLPNGLPQPGDQGLDHTHTWGRTYWGGALFCLLADLEIHRRTANKYGLQDALRAILNAGGNIEVDDWLLERALKAGDEGVGVPVLTELYDRMKAAPAATDLPDLWRKLGVQTAGKTVTFDNNAPWAAIRQAITAKPREVNE
jgi:hypothetical protein